MGFFSAIGSFVSSACSAIGSALGSAAGSLGSFASTALSAVAPWIGPVMQIVSAVAEALGVFNKEDDVEEIGAKAMQADTKKAEEFNSNAEYMDYLRDEVELDKESFDNAGETERLARMGVGVGLAMRGINEEKGFDVPLEAWVSIGKLGLGKDGAKEVDTIIDTFKEGGLKEFAQYVDGKLEGIDNNAKVEDTLTKMYQELEPTASIEDIEQKVMKTQVGDIKPPEDI